MSIDIQQDYFALFDLPRRYRIDESVLEAAWHDLQTEIHPDRFAASPEAERRRAMQWASRVNEAFLTLRKPLLRARYLLELAGVDTGLETNTAMSPEFLMEQMEWREAVEEARVAGDIGELEQLHQRLCARSREAFGGLARMLDDERDYAAAADRVRQLMFVEKLRQEIDDALEALET